MKKILLFNVFMLTLLATSFAQNNNKSVYGSKSQNGIVAKNVSTPTEKKSASTSSAVTNPEYVLDKRTNRKVLVAKPKNTTATKVKNVNVETIND